MNGIALEQRLIDAFADARASVQRTPICSPGCPARSKTPAPAAATGGGPQDCSSASPPPTHCWRSFFPISTMGGSPCSGGSSNGSPTSCSSRWQSGSDRSSNASAARTRPTCSAPNLEQARAISCTDVAYYLIFTSFVLFTVTFVEAADWKQATGAQLKHEVARVGGILLIMGVLHAANVVEVTHLTSKQWPDSSATGKE